MKTLIKISITSLLIALILALACIIGLVPKAQAVVPPPDGGYPNFNTAEGQDALLSLTTGTANTAVGWLSLKSVIGGSFNTGVGAGTLVLNAANENTAFGAAALLLNISGEFNTAVGVAALLNNDSGSFNTAVGEHALEKNTAASGNTAVGYNTLFDTTGGSNTAVGVGALTGNTTGNGNTAIGNSALGNNTTGTANVALGQDAGASIMSASNVICIGTDGADTSNTTWIGNIYNTTTVSSTTLPVVVSDGGQLGTTPSSRRFKKEIKSMDSVSDAILALKPVTFQYKSDKTATPQFGLIAEEVAQVNPNLVVRDKNGDIYTVRYDAVNAMLLNEFLKEHKKVEQLQATVAHQQKDFQAAIAKLKETVTAQLNEQAAQVQKVSAQLAAASPSFADLK